MACHTSHHCDYLHPNVGSSCSDTSDTGITVLGLLPDARVDLLLPADSGNVYHPPHLPSSTYQLTYEVDIRNDAPVEYENTLAGILSGYVAFLNFVSIVGESKRVNKFLGKNTLNDA